MNLIVIVTDSLRADHCGCYPNCQSYNGRPVATSNFDRLAEDATTFLYAYGESLPTMPMRTTWWTGRVCFPFRGWQTFETGDRLLAELLWEHGFTSALFSDTYHLHKPGFNCGRGFDTVGWVRGNEYDPWIIDDVEVDISQWHRLRGDDTDEMWGARFEQYLRNRSTFKREEDWFAPQVTSKAVNWLEDQVNNHGRRDNLFLWADYFTPHEPWDPPEPYWSMYRDPDYAGQDLIDPVPGPVEGYLSAAEVQRVKSLYAGEVTFVDKWAGQVLDKVRELGLYDDSLVMWLSDHGEPFGEHGIIRKARAWSYEELVHIPWLLKLPAAMQASSSPRVEALVQASDLMPTVLDAIELPASHRPAMHGASLLPLLRGEIDKVSDYAYSGFHGQSWAIQDHEWRYQVFLDRSRPPELFHRPSDPQDQDNVARQHPEMARRLDLELRRWVASLT